MERKKKKIGEILVEKGMLKPEQLNLALKEQKISDQFLGEILLKKRWIKESELLAVLSEQFTISIVELKYKYVDWKLLGKYSPSLVMDFHCVPVSEDDVSVTMALTNPLDLDVLQKAEAEARGLKVKLVLTTKSDIDHVIERYRDHVKSKYK